MMSGENAKSHPDLRSCSTRFESSVASNPYADVVDRSVLYVCVSVFMSTSVSTLSVQLLLTYFILSEKIRMVVFGRGGSLLTYAYIDYLLLLTMLCSSTKTCYGWESPGRKQRWQLKTDQNGVKVWDEG